MNTYSYQAQEVLTFGNYRSVRILDTLGNEAELRRFSSLIVESEVPRGRLQPTHLLRVVDTTGHRIALKILAAESSNQLPSGAFFEEYKNQALLNGIKGFPAVYGYGSVNGNPAFLMEWIEGETLVSFRKEREDVSGQIVARIGVAILQVLGRTRELTVPFVHRDLSPSNIMIRTDHVGLEQQIRDGSFDVCIIDLGSSSSARDADPGFTMQANIFRNGTPAYAAPEMLTNDITGIEALRRSTTIDTYALCSILYELYSGRTPFEKALWDSPSPYRTKLDTEPEPLQPACEDDQGLVDAILAGIKADQNLRCSQEELLVRLDAWLKGEEYHAVDKSTADVRGNVTPESSGQRPSPALGTAQDQPSSKFLMPNRRQLLVAAGIGLTCLVGAGVATRGFGIIDRMNGIKGGLDEYSWDELASIAEIIAAAETDEDALEIAVRYRLADTDGSLANRPAKPIELADGTQTAARLIGLRHDAVANGSGVCGLSFLFDSPIAARPMNSQPVPTGGWESCEAREWLNNDGFDLLPHELSKQIRTVTKLTNNTGGTTSSKSVTQTHDRLWLPSYVELVGRRSEKSFSSGFEFLAAILNAEGNQYSLYRELNTEWTDENSFLRKSFEDKGCYWWIRTPSADVSLDEKTTFFNRVGPDGNPFRYATDSSSLRTTKEDGKPGVNTLMPGFCL